MYWFCPVLYMHRTKEVTAKNKLFIFTFKLILLIESHRVIPSFVHSLNDHINQVWTRLKEHPGLLLSRGPSAQATLNCLFRHIHWNWIGNGAAKTNQCTYELPVSPALPQFSAPPVPAPNIYYHKEGMGFLIS